MPLEAKILSTCIALMIALMIPIARSKTIVMTELLERIFVTLGGVGLLALIVGVWRHA